MQKLIYVGLGGFIGASLRYGVLFTWQEFYEMNSLGDTYCKCNRWNIDWIYNGIEPNTWIDFSKFKVIKTYITVTLTIIFLNLIFYNSS